MGDTEIAGNAAQAFTPGPNDDARPLLLQDAAGLGAVGVPRCSPPTSSANHSIRVEERDAGQRDRVYLAHAIPVASKASALTTWFLDAHRIEPTIARGRVIREGGRQSRLLACSLRTEGMWITKSQRTCPRVPSSGRAAFLLGCRTVVLHVVLEHDGAGTRRAAGTLVPGVARGAPTRSPCWNGWARPGRTHVSTSRHGRCWWWTMSAALLRAQGENHVAKAPLRFGGC